RQRTVQHPGAEQERVRHAQAALHQLRVSHSFVGEETGSGWRIDRTAPGIRDGLRQPGEGIVRPMPQGEIIEMEADGETTMPEPPLPRSLARCASSPLP